MKTSLSLCFTFATLLVIAGGQTSSLGKNSTSGIDYIIALKDTLSALIDNADDEFFIIHCESIIDVIDSRSSLSAVDSTFLENMYFVLNDENDTCSMKEFNTYLNRRRSLILAWTSPTDGALSFSWLKLPNDWNPDNEYPLYIQLHGLWGVADNPIDYLTYPYLGSPSTSTSFEDGYLLSPWGRGNLWYQGISETDIWECMATLEEIAAINPARKYISGHSMGGYGAWHIALNSPNTWAALGVHAGALWYGSPNEVNAEAAETLKDMPTYFVCGTNDGLLAINQTVYALLEDAGNQNIEFVTFVGSHEYIEENVLNMYLWMREFTNDDWNTVNEKTLVPVFTDNRFSSFPNPFSSGTTIRYNVPYGEHITIEIFNQNGQRLTILVDEYNTTGDYQVFWNPKDLSPGAYYCRIMSDKYLKTLKLILE